MTKQGEAMLADAKALATKRKLNWGAMNKIDQGSIMKQAHNIIIKAETAKAVKARATSSNVPRQKAAQALRKQSTYIGETNWKTLQKKYHPKQLAWATELKEGNRMWRSDRKISNFKHDKKEEDEIKKLRSNK